MAYKGKKVVVWCPFGRENTVSILFNYLLANKDIVDEVWLCMNTDPEQESDRFYAELLAAGNPDFVKLKHYEGKPLQPKQLNTGRFYKQMTAKDTLYIRMDDDIVYVHDDYFKNLISTALDSRDSDSRPFLLFGHIWNNSVISYLQQQVYHNLDEKHGIVRAPFAMDVVAWQSPTFAEYIHETLLKHIEDGTVDKLYIPDYRLADPQRFSVSNFLHFGEDFAEFKGDLKGQEEEQWLTEVYPSEKGVRNMVAGTAIVCHWAFFAQRPHLEMNTNLLERYEKLSQKKLSGDYYKLLKLSNDSQKML